MATLAAGCVEGGSEGGHTGGVDDGGESGTRGYLVVGLGEEALGGDLCWVDQGAIAGYGKVLGGRGDYSVPYFLEMIEEEDAVSDGSFGCKNYFLFFYGGD